MSLIYSIHMENKNSTIQDVLVSIQDLSEAVNESFTALEEKIDNVKTELRAEFRSEISSIKSTMVTKDYLDQKFREH